MIHIAASPDSAIENVQMSERERVLAFLKGGNAILYTTAKAPDRLAPERGRVVPLSVRSDGTWVWSDAHAYYAEAHGLAPEPALLAHIRTCGYVCRRLGPEEAEQVLEAFGASS